MSTAAPQQQSPVQYGPPTSQPGPPLQLAAAANITAAPTQTSTPRRTLTDADRRKMCMFHEENPNVKQTEIGGMRVAES